MNQTPPAGQTDKTEDRRQWLKGFLGRPGAGDPPNLAAPRAGAGDRIGANVGEGAQGVAVGKNIIQIGTLVVPTVPVLLLLVVMGSGIVFLGLKLSGLAGPRGPATMQGAFNVAIAEFGQDDGKGHVTHSDDGARLSRWVYDSLRAQLDAFPDTDVKTDVQIWHDSLPAAEKGTTLGIVANEQEAAKLAERVGAHMVIWGNLDPQRGFIPRFYISSQLQGDSDAVVGQYQVGDRPVPVDMSAPEFVKRALTERTNLLFWYTIGLRQENYGFAQKALEVFRQAETYAIALQGQQEGAEILYFLLGQAALFADDDNTAQAALEKALAINPGFVRAQVVLGSVYLRRAQRLTGQDRLETTDWEQAVREYEKAIAMAPASKDPVWGLGAAPLALGMAYKIEGDAYLGGKLYDQADQNYDVALTKTQAALAPLLAADTHRLLGQAYSTLGSVYWQKAEIQRQQGNPQEMRALLASAGQAYDRCIAQGDEARFDTILTERVIGNGCRPLRDAVTKALETPPGG